MNKSKTRPVSAKPTVSFGKFNDHVEQRISQDLLVTKYLEEYVNDPKKSQRNSRPSKRYISGFFNIL